MVGLRCVAQPILWEPKCLRFQSTSKQCIFRAKGMEATLSIQYNYMYNIYIYTSQRPQCNRALENFMTWRQSRCSGAHPQMYPGEPATYQQNKHSSMVFHGPMTYHKGWPIIRDDFPWPPWPFDDPWSCPRMISSRCSASCLGTWKKTYLNLKAMKSICSCAYYRAGEPLINLMQAPWPANGFPKSSATYR